MVDERWRETAKGKFVREVNERMKDAWRSDGSVQEKWAVRRTVMCETAALSWDLLTDRQFLMNQTPATWESLPYLVD